jgi:hypothetical protein
MLKKIYIVLFLPALMLVMNSCNEDEQIQDWIDQNPLPDEPSVTPGSLDLSNYVAMGNSLTSGFADAVLFPLGQSEAYPSVLARQFVPAGGGDFTFPNIVTGNGFGSAFGMTVGRSFADAGAASDPNADLSEIIQFSEPGTIGPSTVPITSLNNFGIPGIRMIDMNVDGFMDGSYYDFFGANQSVSVLQNVLNTNPTFFSAWLGNNDVLTYALAGGVSEALISDAGAFQAAATEVIGSMAAAGVEGVVLNIPPITIIPYFQFVPWNAIELDQATADFSNAAYTDWNALMDNLSLNPGIPPEFQISVEEATARKISFAAGPNGNKE